MLTIKGNDIHLTKGDSAYLNVEITNDDETPYAIKEGDTLTMTVKATNGTKIFSKTVQAYESIILEPKDTINVGVGRYKYDIQLNTENQVYTIIPVSSFFVEEGITDE